MKNRVVWLFALGTSLFSMSSFAVNCSGLSAWESTKIYTKDMQVKHSTNAYKAKWWTRNESPATSGQWGVWGLLGACDSTSSLSSSSRSSSSSSLSISSKSSSSTSPKSSSSSSIASSVGSNCGSSQYLAGTSYSINQVVQNAGNEYRCKVAGWCSSAASWAYAPPTGQYWQDAWSFVKSCSGSISSSSMSSLSNSSSSSLGGSSSSSGLPGNDVFGLTKKYPSLLPEVSWDSRHWNNTPTRVISGRDALDPAGWSEVRGDSPQLTVVGDGRLDMRGIEPRLYINPYPRNVADKSQAEHLFTNVEITAYFRRLSNDGPAYGGFTIGARSGPLGHDAAGGNNCDATTYYSRLRNDGNWQFEKELKHPASSVVKTKKLYSTGLPLNTWIGIKYVVATKGSSVNLSAWIDTTEGLNGGTWTLLGEYTDAGNWLTDADYGSLHADGCSYSVNTPIVPGGGTVLIRNTNGKGEYKWVSVREIKPQ